MSAKFGALTIFRTIQTTIVVRALGVALSVIALSSADTYDVVVTGPPPPYVGGVVPITPAGFADWTPALVSPPNNNNNNNDVVTELVDQVESIDVTATQAVVVTSKRGAPDSLRHVALTAVDVETRREVAPLNLTGIVLTLVRGRYTLALQPDRWYGLTFRSEQTYMPPDVGATPSVYVGEERHLIRTHKADGSHSDAPLVDVQTRRYDTGGRSLENLVVSVLWTQHPSERPDIDALANITLFCRQHIKYKQLRLHDRELEKSVEVKLDNHFEIMEYYNGSRQIIASITPKNCPRICWNVELVAEVGGGTPLFRRAATHNCQPIGAVSARTALREYLGYSVDAERVTVHTNYTSGTADGRRRGESDAYVQLIAVPLPVPRGGADNSTIRFKTFSTKTRLAHQPSDPAADEETNGVDDFVLDNLEPERLHAVEYKYGRESPFAYAESRRFVVETAAAINSATRRISPVRLIVEDVAEVATAGAEQHRSEKSKHESGNLTASSIHSNAEPSLPPPPPPRLVMRLDPKFQEHEIGIDLDPFCEHPPQPIVSADAHPLRPPAVVTVAANNTKSHFWLTADRPARELRHLDVVGAVCTATDARHPLCAQQKWPTRGGGAGHCAASRSANLCYTPSVRVNDKLYAMTRRCVDLARRIGAQFAAAAKTAATAAAEAAAAEAAAANATVKTDVSGDEPMGSGAEPTMPRLYGGGATWRLIATLTVAVSMAKDAYPRVWRFC